MNISQVHIIKLKNITFTNHKMNSQIMFVIQNVKGINIYINKEKNVISLIFDDSSINAKCFALVSRSIAS